MVDSTILPLTLDGATVRKGGQQIVGPLALTMGGVGCSIVIGPNGAGKTTLLRLMHGLERASSGSVKWALKQSEVFTRQSFVFQTPVVMRRSVIENIAYPLHVRGIDRKIAIGEAEKWIDKVGLMKSTHKDANVLSGGEKQKLAIARALITKPDVLFLDEPTTNLDGSSTQDIEKLIRRARDAGTRIVMATHDFGQARRLADEVLFMHHGIVHERAAAEIFFADPGTTEAQVFLRGDLLL
ncbi:MAG: ATP-binding cassette domain-containing protein [Sneathiella sp.]|nr:ATP-binding cassette domain-containing protein [Sneathiella sp.]